MDISAWSSHSQFVQFFFVSDAARGGKRLVFHYIIICVEVASSDDVGLVEVLDRFGRGLDAQFSSFSCSKEVLPQTPLDSSGSCTIWRLPRSL